ncbi:MAG TPA: Ig-like domain-containing protein [Verrucomicrobiae bacterium]
MSVINDSFSPLSTNINVNDTVLWTWPSGSDDHNVTSTSSPKQAWTASPTENGPISFSVMFTNAGSYPYECTVHASVGMRATVTVVAAPTPPSLAITNPASGAVFSAPANVSIKTGVTNGSSAVTSVQFYTNNISLGTVASAPFNFIANNLATGSYALTAVATAGAITATSPVVNISVVTPVTVALSNSAAASSTNFQFSYAANVGLSYVVQVSSNLTGTWASLVTNVAASNPVVFVDPHATNNAGYYRVGLLPNP